MSWSDEENLNECLIKLLGKHFDKLKNQLQMCVCECPDGSNAWECFSGEMDVRKELSRRLSEDGVGSLSDGCELTDGHHVVFHKEKTVRDSRISSSSSEKQVLLVFYVRLDSEPMRLLAKICAHELLRKLKDMLYLERLNEVDCLDRLDRIEKTSVYAYLFGNLREKDWVIREYVNRALKDNQLPDRNVFAQISEMCYEKRTIDTSMCFCSEKELCTLSKKMLVLSNESKKKKSNLSDLGLRYIRKLLELSGSGHALLVKRDDGGYTIEGVVKESDFLTKTILAKFENYLIWKLIKDGKTIFEYCKGIYKLPELESKDNIDEQLNKLDTLQIKDSEREKIKSVISEAMKKSQHGTSIIFMDKKTLNNQLKDLELYNRAFRVVDKDLKDVVENFESVLAIDGAIIAGTDCSCHAVGAIVEAELKVRGVPGRGARYNSLVNYVHAVFEKEKANPNRKEAVVCFAVIISEDETIDIEIPRASNGE